MSASLVGSEMCIRDRARGRAVSVEPAPREKKTDWPGRARAGMGPEGDPPVSYTHLTLPTICSV
eukprot:13775478-Alexandrium_andersonii.AAC.1